jgi:Ran GTPase-activating protein (RanGAP) involved in mRNA processing and transport
LNQNIAIPLRKLDVSHNLFGSKGMQLLAECLKDNTGLRHLNVSFNQIGDKGAKSVAHMIQSHRKNFPLQECVQELKLNGNEIDTEGMVYLFNSLTPKQIKAQAKSG